LGFIWNLVLEDWNFKSAWLPAKKQPVKSKKKPCHFGAVSYKRGLWPEKTASLIGKEIVKKRISNVE